MTTAEIVMNSEHSPHAGQVKIRSLGKSRFTEMLIKENGLDQNGFERWIFCQGMLFNSPHKWWGDHGTRDYPHEGIDLCLYEETSGRIRRIDENTRIPAMHDGVVKAIFKDYLGKSLVIEHVNAADSNDKFISLYAHTTPRNDMGVGVIVTEGDVIATLGDTRNTKARIIPHLHFSLGLPSEALSFDGFEWNTIRNPDMMVLLDPMPIIDRPHQALDAGSPVCREL